MPDRPQVFTEKCSTCVFHSGNRMMLEPGRLQDLVEQNRAAGAVLICHKTLPYGDHPEVGQTMCRGYFDAYGADSNVARVMERLHALTGGEGTWYAEVEPPPD